MTTDQLQQKHLQAIINDAEPHEEIPALIVSKQKTAKQCALITIEHTIGVLEEMKMDEHLLDGLLYPSEVYRVFNMKIDFRISELKKQKEQL